MLLKRLKKAEGILLFIGDNRIIVQSRKSQPFVLKQFLLKKSILIINALFVVLLIIFLNAKRTFK